MAGSQFAIVRRAMALALALPALAMGCLPEPDCSQTATCPVFVPEDAGSDASPNGSSDASDVSSDRGADGSVDQGPCGSPSDPKNCGVCGHDCTTLANVAPGAAGIECRLGTCFVPATACGAGFAHCSSRPDEGCETDLSDSKNCGGCGTACSGSTPLCSKTASGAKCSDACSPPSADPCSASCVNLQSDAKNCGTCGHDCAALPNVAPGAAGIECRLGVCYVPPTACKSGFAHCSSRPDEGCEANLLDAQSCGTCATACAGATPICSSSASGPTCGANCAGNAPDVCATLCVDLKSDTKNCGMCGHDCGLLPNVKPGASGIACRAGLCNVPPGACASGFAHCSTRGDDGCETDTTLSDNCGQCGKKCTAPTGLCTSTAGAPACTSSCAAPAPDLCGSKCVDVKSDPTNCGVCGHDCTALPEVRPGASGIECRAGTCYVPPSACNASYAHCSTRADDGCETDLTRPTSCGQCGKACTAPTALCSTTTGAPACSSSCATPSPDLCGSKCVDLGSDVANCGACGHNCTTLANVKPGATGIQCRSGVCSVPASACVSGFAHCSLQPDDGCEANLTEARTCGSCTNSCPATAPVCSTSSTPFTCLPNCTGTTPTPCGTQCVDTQHDPKHCGSCTTDCSALPNVKANSVPPAVQCIAGACALQPAACVSGFGHCSSRPSDGCETNVTLPATCGSCTNACAAPLGLCSSTTGVPTCSSSCTAPKPDPCGSSCTDTRTDPTNCGTCGHDCTKLPHLRAGAAVQCSAGNCVVPATACAAGFANCAPAANDTDGCETPTNTNANCGGCAVPCNLPNAVASCATGSCSVASCNDGFGDCTSAAGCETPLNTTAHCGTCATQCTSAPANAAPTCTSIGCSFRCNSLVCNGACVNEQTDGSNCGTCGHVCPLGCSSAKCKCGTPENNPVPNAGFDTGLAPWNGGAAAAWIGDDAFGCGASGSMRLTTLNTVSATDSMSVSVDTAITPGTYTLGARLRKMPGSSAGVFTMDAYVNNGADGFAHIPFTNVTTFPDWTVVTVQTALTISTAVNVLIQLALLKQDAGVAPFDIEVDTIYFSPVPSQGWK